MAYLWSDKIIDYYYSNPELDTVAVLWKDPDDDLTREHYIKVDESDEQWRDFVAEVSYDDINTRTEERHEHFREEFREAFRLWMTRPENDMTEIQYVDRRAQALIDGVFEKLFEFDPKDTAQKEELFKFKLKIFEQEIVKNSKSTDKFKKAKTETTKKIRYIKIVFIFENWLCWISNYSIKVAWINTPSIPTNVKRADFIIANNVLESNGNVNLYIIINDNFFVVL